MFSLPLYELLCTRCGHRFEELCAYDRIEAILCPKCGAAPKRLISGFAFKSSGYSGNETHHTGSSCASCSSGSCASCGH
ncbi:MAG: FmdB family zinc ribbon protein [Patescibacteria group bacterium]